MIYDVKEYKYENKKKINIYYINKIILMDKLIIYKLYQLR